MPRSLGLVCPQHQMPLAEVSGTDRLYCPNQEHDGRPASHPEGSAPRTRAFFTLADLENSTFVVARPPRIANVVLETPPTTEDGQRSCTKCGGTYPPGGYGIHKDTTTHLRALGKVATA